MIERELGLDHDCEYTPIEACLKAREAARKEGKVVEAVREIRKEHREESVEGICLCRTCSIPLPNEEGEPE